MNPYDAYVTSFARLIAEGKSLPLGNIPAGRKFKPTPGGPTALIFSPHPDDECIIGGLALRLLREAGWRVVNVAVTLGSDPARRPARRQELGNACDRLGFDLEVAAPEGLEKIIPETRAREPRYWTDAVNRIAARLAEFQPRAIFFPHELDWHSTHIGTHFLVMDALKTLPAGFQSCLVETEFWGQMASPNLMVESGAEDVADLLAALSCHAGEVRRNPYHLRLPAWLADNVRRGAELVGGRGGAAPDFMFATLYRVRRWKDGGVENAFSGGAQVGIRENPAALLGRV